MAQRDDGPLHHRDREGHDLDGDGSSGAESCHELLGRHEDHETLGEGRDHPLPDQGSAEPLREGKGGRNLVRSIEGDVDHSLTVISDSDLYASSGEILTKAEMEERALERMLRAFGTNSSTLDSAYIFTEVRSGNIIDVHHPSNATTVTFTLFRT